MFLGSWSDFFLSAASIILYRVVNNHKMYFLLPGSLRRHCDGGELPGRGQASRASPHPARGPWGCALLSHLMDCYKSRYLFSIFMMTSNIGIKYSNKTFRVLFVTFIHWCMVKFITKRQFTVTRQNLINRCNLPFNFILNVKMLF